MAEKLRGVFEPQSIAIVGASTRVGSIGNVVVKNMFEKRKRKINKKLILC
jgi:acyl-CoA synthetase (NDP forming)